MNTYFVRTIVALLVPVLVAGDPRWAHGLMDGRSLDSSRNSPLISTQALIPHLASGFRPVADPLASHIAVEAETVADVSESGRRGFLRVLAILSAAVTQIVAAPPPVTTQDPFNSISIADTMKADKSIAENSFGQYWHLGVPRPDYVDNVNPAVFSYLVDNSEETDLYFLDNQAAIERYFAASSKMTSESFASDRNRAASFNFAQGFGESLSTMVVFPTFNDQSPLTNNIEQHPAEKSGFFHHLFAGIRDVLLHGGVEWNNGMPAAKNLVRIATAATDVHMGWKNVEASGETLAKTYQRGLNDLRFYDHLIQLKEFELQSVAKHLAEWTNPAYREFLPSDFVSQTSALKDREASLTADINTFKTQRQKVSDSLRRMEKWTQPMSKVKSVTPRHPIITLDRAWLEGLANLALPDDEKPLTPVRLSDDLTQKLRQGLLVRLADGVRQKSVSAAVLAHAKNLDPYSDEFLSLVLNQVWTVPGASSIGESILPVNPEDRPTLQELTTVPAEDEKLLGYPPAVRRILFAQQRGREAQQLIRLNEKSEIAVAFRLNWSLALPVRLDISGNKQLNVDRLKHEDTAEGILAAKAPILIQQLMKDGPLKDLQETRSDWIDALRKAREWARQTIQTYSTLSTQLNMGATRRRTIAKGDDLDQLLANVNGQGHDQVSVPDIATPAEVLVHSRASARAFLSNAYGEKQNFALLTPEGQEARATQMGDHFNSTMRFIKLNADIKDAPATDEDLQREINPPTPAPEKAEPAPKEKQHIQWPWQTRKKADSQAAPTRRSVLERIPGLSRAGTIAALLVVTAFSLPANPLHGAAALHAMIPGINPLAHTEWWWVLPALIAVGTFTHRGIRLVNTRWNVRLPLSGLVGLGMFLTYPLYMANPYFWILMGYFAFAGFRSGWKTLTPFALAFFYLLPVPTHPLLFATSLLMMLWGRWHSNYMFSIVMGAVLYFTLPAWLPVWALAGLPIVLSVLSLATAARWNLQIDKKVPVLYAFMHYRKRLGAVTNTLQWVARVAVTGFALSNIVSIGVRMVDRVINGMSLTGQDSTESHARVYKRSLFLAAPRGQSGIITNNPLSKGLTHVSAFTTDPQAVVGGGRVKIPVYAVAWKSEKDSLFLQRIREINNELSTTPNLRGLSIQGANILETDAVTHPYTHALLQVTSDNAEGSVEMALQKALEKTQAALDRYQNHYAHGQELRETTQNGTLSAEEGLTSQEIGALVKTINALLLERSWRDVRVLKDFELAPDQSQLSGRTAFTASPLTIGTLVRRDAGRFDFIFTRDEARSFASFLYQPDAVAVLEDLVTKQQVYFRAQDVKEVSELANRGGFISQFDSIQNEGLISVFQLGANVILPDGQKLTDNEKNYRFVGTFPRSAQRFDGSWNLEKQLHAPKEQANEYVALVQLIPNTPSNRQFAGPHAALSALEDALHSVAKGFEARVAKTKAVLGKLSDSALGNRIRTTVESVQLRAQDAAREAQDAASDVASVRAAWGTKGIPDSDVLSTANATHPAGKAYPANAIVTDNPIEQKYPVTLGADNSSEDPQVLYPIGSRIRLRIQVELQNSSKLALDPKHPLTLHIEGTDIDLPITDLERSRLFERGFSASRIEFETSVDSSLLRKIFPSVARGEAPTGEVLGIIRRAGPIAQPVPHAQNVQPSSLPHVAALGVLGAVGHNATTNIETDRRTFFSGLVRPLKSGDNRSSIAGLVFPLALQAFSYDRIVPLFKKLTLMIPIDSLHVIYAVAITVGLGIAALLLPLIVHGRIFRLNEWFRKKAPEAELQSVSGAVRPNVENTEFEGVSLLANGSQFPSALAFLEMIGKWRIQSSSYYSSRARNTVGTEWNDILDKALIINAMKAGTTYLSDSTIAMIAPAIDGFQTSKINPLTKEGIREEFKRALGEDFDRHLKIIVMDTQSRQSVMDVTATADTRTLRIDGRLLRQYLDVLHRSNVSNDLVTVNDRLAAETAIATIFIYALGYPTQGTTQNAQKETWKQIQRLNVQQFLGRINTMWQEVDHLPLGSSYSLRIAIQNLRKERHENDGDRIGVPDNTRPLDLTLELPGLLDFLKNRPLKQEVTDENGNRLSPWKILARGFSWDMNAWQARLLTAKYRVDRMEPWAQKRTSFVTGTVWGWKAFALLYLVLYPTALGTVLSSLLRGNLNWALLFTHPIDAGVPAWTLSLLVGLFIFSLFQSSFKTVSELLTAGSQPVFRDILKGLGVNAVDASFQEKISLVAPDTTVNNYLNVFYANPALSDETLFQEYFFRFANMITIQLRGVLDDDRVEFGYKRYFINALYLYAQEHPKKGFFERWQTIQLPSNYDVLKEMIAKDADFLTLSVEEVKKLFEADNALILQDVRSAVKIPDLTPAQLGALNEGQRRRVFLALAAAGFHDWSSGRYDEIETYRTQLASNKMMEYPVDVLLLLISRDLTGLAFFNPDEEDGDRTIMRAAMAPVLRALIQRTSTLAPEVYESWREQSRDTRMWQPTHLAIHAVRRNQRDTAPLLFNAYKQVISPLIIDVTTVEPGILKAKLESNKLFTGHPGRVNAFLAWVRFWSPRLAIMNERYPRLTFQLKRLLMLIDKINEPVEMLGVNMLLKNMDIKYRNNAVAILRGILIQKFHEEQVAHGRVDIDALVASDDFLLFNRVAEQNHLSLKEYLLAFQGDPLAQHDIIGDEALTGDLDARRQSVLRHFVDNLTLPEGVTTGLIGQQDQRGGKINPAAHSERLGKQLPQEDPSDPTLFPKHLADLILPNEDLKATVSVAEMKNVEQAGSNFLNLLIRQTPPNGPRAFGHREILMESTMPRFIKSAVLSAQRNTLLTHAQTYVVAISDILKSFMKDIDDRISERLSSSSGLAVEVLMFRKIKQYLRTPRTDRRVFFVSPELKSTQLVLDSRIKDTEVVLVPHPTLFPAAMGVFFAMLPESEKEPFYTAVAAAHGDAAVQEIRDRGEELMQIVLSSHLAFQTFAKPSDRWKWNPAHGDYDDTLRSILPPNGFRTIAIVAAGARQKPEPPSDIEHQGPNVHSPHEGTLNRAA